MGKTKVAQFAIRAGSTQAKVFALLSDKRWHCRECEGKKVASAQYAGGGGIQGLQRGTRTRSGLVIEQRRKPCERCGKMTTWDRWTGRLQSASVTANIPKSLAQKILEVYAYTDVVEGRQRPAHELVIDHRFPMARWGENERPHTPNMSEAEIKVKFQLLKKDSAGNHNLLKSRSCEGCLKTGRRGTPFGIEFWYTGNVEWPKETPPIGPQAEDGCVGCGWYDLQAWRTALNRKLTRPAPPTKKGVAH